MVFAAETIRIAGLQKESIVDGPGLRFTIFTQGCPHRCVSCHNPQSWSPDGGKEVSINEIIEDIGRNPLLKGVTFSGGEPFCQPDKLYQIAIRLENKDIICYTGYTFEELLEMSYENQDILNLLSVCDYLVDGKFEIEHKTLNLKFRGSSNQRFLDLKESMKEKKAVAKEI